ncbi:hypothetical protein D3C71_1543540 [compost metagenome]
MSDHRTTRPHGGLLEPSSLADGGTEVGHRRTVLPVAAEVGGVVAVAWTVVAGGKAVAERLVFTTGTAQGGLQVGTAIAAGGSAGTQVRPIVGTGRPQGNGHIDHVLGGVVTRHVLGA